MSRKDSLSTLAGSAGRTIIPFSSIHTAIGTLVMPNSSSQM